MPATTQPPDTDLHHLYIAPKAFFEVCGDTSLKPKVRETVLKYLSYLGERGILRLNGNDQPGRGRYVYISNTTGRRLFGDRTFKVVTDYCATKGYTKVNGSYIAGAYAKSFRIQPNYRDLEEFPYVFQTRRGHDGEIQETEYEPGFDWDRMPALRTLTFSERAGEVLETMVAAATKEAREALIAANTAAGHGHHKEARRLRKEAQKCFTKAICARYNFRQLEAGRIWTAEHLETGRLFTAASNLPAELRAEILIDGEPCCEIDVRNSQPLLCISLYAADSEERERYLKVVSTGKFYEAINAGLAVPMDRDELKPRIFHEIFYGKPDVPGRECWEVFTKLFPELAATIRAMKIAKGKGALAIKLQSLEAKAVIRGVLENANIMAVPIITVHDGIVAKKKDAAKVGVLLKAHVGAIVGFEPALSGLDD